MKIIISDFDLTFYDNNFLDNIKIINNWKKSGNKFVIATGRSMYDLKPIIDSYNVKGDYYICNDGGAIYDDNYKEIYRKDLDPNVSVSLFNDLVETKAFDKVLVDTSKTITANNTACANRIIAVLKDRNEAETILKNILNKYHNVGGYLSTNHLNITDISVNKANGVNFLINKNNWSKENIYAIGDEINDIEMLTEFNGFLIDRKNNSFNLKTVASFKEMVELIDESNQY